MSDWFRCPNCKEVTEKTEDEKLLGETRGMVLGPTQRNCKICSRAIDRGEIAKGTYDVPAPSGTWGCLVSLAIAAVVFGLIVHFCK